MDFPKLLFLLISQLAPLVYHTTSHRVILDMLDPGDAPFLEVALAEGALLITGNEMHYPEDKREGCRILAPGEFLRILFS